MFVNNTISQQGRDYGEASEALTLVQALRGYQVISNQYKQYFDITIILKIKINAK